MQHRVIRLTLGAALAFVAVAPATSHAITCGTKLQQVCFKVFQLCNVADVTQTACAKIGPL